MKEVGVVILNWNGEQFLRKFIPTLIANTPEADIILADNGSIDGSLDNIKSNFQTIKIIENGANYGFCKGYNLALEGLDYKYFVLLNSDVEVTENWLSPIIQYMEKNNNIAACQPKIKSFAQKNYFEYAGAAGGFLDKYGYPFCRGRVFETVEEDKGQFENSTAIGWASGACLVVKAEVYKKLNGLDEDFFAHMEEIDLCWRIWSNGYQVHYVAQSQVFHVGGGTLPKNSAFKTYLNFRNSLFLIHKNLETRYLPLYILLRLCLDGLAGIKFLVQGYPKDTIAIIKAHFDYYRNIKKLNIKRNNQLQSKALLKPYSIVWQYFVLQKRFFVEF